MNRKILYLCVGVFFIFVCGSLIISRFDSSSVNPVTFRELQKVDAASATSVRNPPPGRALLGELAASKSPPRAIQVRDATDKLYSAVFEYLIKDRVLREKTLALVAERTLIVYDTREVYLDLRAQGKAPPNFSTLIAQSQRTIDEEIKQLLGDPLGTQISALASAPEHLRELNEVFLPALENASLPVSSEQAARLALAMVMVYGSPNNPELVVNEHNYDPASGLRKLDFAFLEEVSPVLSPEQLEIYRALRKRLNKANLVTSK